MLVWEKLYSHICLVNQPFIKDDKKTIQDLLNEIIARTGEKIIIKRFVRYKIGERF